MLRNKWFTQWIVATTFLILLAGCAPGVNPAVSGHERTVAETRFENHTLTAIAEGDSLDSAKIQNCLSEPVAIKVGVVGDKDAWILIEIQDGEWQGVDVAGNMRYWVTMKSAAADDEAFTEIGGFMGGGEVLIVASDVPFVPIISDKSSCE